MLDRHSAALLGIGLELGLERREFGKGRIRIRRLVSLAPLEALAVSSIVPTITVARRTILPVLAGMPLAAVAFAAMPLTMSLSMTLTAAAATGMAAFAARRTVGRMRCRTAGF
jgi:hypothetical protein